MVKLRPFVAEDIYDVVSLFRDTIHFVNAKDYTIEQLNAWAPAQIDGARWCAKLVEHFTVVAESGGVICGFGDLHDNGYFDHLFVHKDYQGIGVGSLIVREIERSAVAKGIPVLEVHVSITAKTFFLNKGYVIETEQQVEYNGQLFTNFRMKKQL
ncbi:GNAT family N-acetyltransferase [Flavobacterium sp. RHBU_3]|uniref:GNAT family N-acetyltransferase n=1 Tax=Flavobacterium sp. RHBU_3 TaxID=3391184 RepID=UPI0039848D99